MKGHFSRFLGARPDRLHFAAHSHHPWPDVTFEAQQRAWLDAAQEMDDKWEGVFTELIPETQERLARVLGLEDPSTLVFAPNTHELVVRLFSCLSPPVRVLTTDAEFHSFERQARRWEEAGLAGVERVPAEPFETFGERFVEAAARGFDLVYLSHVLFDSGFVVPDLAGLVEALPAEAWVVVDGYHGFMAVPTNLAPVRRRAFYLAGGYKYAMAGEGACFMHCPPGYGERPVDTGWFAGFEELEAGSARPTYPTDAGRFYGATFDATAVYRLRAVLRWAEETGLSVEAVHAHVRGLQERFLDRADPPGELLPPRSVPDRGHFLTFRTERAGEIQQALRRVGVVTDHRGDRLRIGFGIYHDPEDVDELVRRMATLGVLSPDPTGIASFLVTKRREEDG